MDYPLVLDVGIVTLLFGMIFEFLPVARLSWRDVRLGEALTTALFFVGICPWSFLRIGAPGSAYGAARSLITMLNGLLCFAIRALRRRVC